MKTYGISKSFKEKIQCTAPDWLPQALPFLGNWLFKPNDTEIMAQVCSSSLHGEEFTEGIDAMEIPTAGKAIPGAGPWWGQGRSHLWGVVLPGWLPGRTDFNGCFSITRWISVANRAWVYTKQETHRVSLPLIFTEQVGIQYLRALCPPLKQGWHRPVMQMFQSPSASPRSRAFPPLPALQLLCRLQWLPWFP